MKGIWVKINTNNVDNVCEILHFVQNDTFFFLNDRKSRQWILRFALNDREKFQNDG